MSRTVLVLRADYSSGESTNGFRWPESGPVEAPDWKPTKVCGNGLHGLLWGCGDAALLHVDEGSTWRVVEVAADDVIDLDGKVKFPRGVVVFHGDRDGALAYLDAHGALDKPAVYATRTAGAGGTATAGAGGTATAGAGGTATATAGYQGTATAGDWGTATAGDRGTATAGYRGTATAGDWGTATAGGGGTATAGAGGTIAVKWWDDDAYCYQLAVANPGEDDIEPNVAYRYRPGQGFVRADGGAS